MRKTLSAFAVAGYAFAATANAQSVNYTTLVRSNVGVTDGVGPAARFNAPRGITIDAAGNLYVLDRFGGSMRKITPGASVTTLIPADGTIFGVTLAATPSGEVLFVNMTSSVVRKRALDGTLSVVYPGGSGGNGPLMIQGNALMLDSGGVMYALDFTGVWRLGTDGSAVRVAGTSGTLGNVDGPIGTAQFDNPNALAIDSAGVMYVSDQRGTVIRRITPDGVTTTIAGLAGSTGTADGTGSAARFRSASALVCDAAGNVYVGDGASIRKVTPQGVVTTFVVAGPPFSVSSITRDANGNFFIADGVNSVIWKVTPDGALSVFAGLRVSTTAGTLASLQQPVGVALDVDGNLLISDAATHTINRLAGGAVTTIAGASGTAGSGDGVAAVTANPGSPTGVAVDANGIVYFTDVTSHAIRRVGADGSISTIAGRLGSSGTADGTGGNARFHSPSSLTIDAAGNLLVGDATNCAIRSVSPAGVVTTIAGRPGVCGNVDGDAAAARLGTIGDLAVDAAGNILIADLGNSAIRRVTADRRVTTIATGFADVMAIAVDAAGNVYANNHWAIQRITPSGDVTTVAGALNEFGSADGSASQARFGWMYALAFAADGTLYIADGVRLRALSPGGTVTTVAGGGGDSPVDGVGTQARFSTIYGIAIDGTGTFYLADGAIRRMTAGAVVETYVARSTNFSNAIDGAGRSSGRLNAPRGLAGAPDGSLYIADTGNHTIRRLSANLLTTIAGSAGLSGSVDGGATSARFNAPAGVARDAAGTLYVADSGNNAVRKISSDGTVSTIAATFNGPRGVAVDGSGTVYVADTGNHVIRAITGTGVVSTLAGTSGDSGNADGTGAAARFSSPEAIVIVDGTLYVADTGNHTIRAVTTGGAVTTVGGTAAAPGFADGSGSSALFFGPAGLASDPSGAIYIAEPPNSAVRIGVIGTSTAPLISMSPIGRSVTLHESVQLTCDATGKPSPSFTWERAIGTSFFPVPEGASFRGVTTRTLTIGDVGRVHDGTRYRCVAKNVAGAAASTPATVTVALLTVSPTRLVFGGIAAPGGGYSSITTPKTVSVGWQGPGAPPWSVTADRPWVQITNGSGAGAGTFTVAVSDPGVLAFLAVSATLTLTGPDPELQVSIPLTFHKYSSNAAPIGVFDTPANNATGLQGSLAVTGWAVDDIDLDRVEIWRDAVAGETTPVFNGSGPGNGKIFIANAIQVPGARPDVAALYGHQYADAGRAGWGYMLLTQGLWNRGNGTFRLYAFGFDKSGAFSTLGTKTITIDNENATKPFGTIDTPSYGGTVSGVVTNFGWALTPGACLITNPNVQVSIDSGPLSAVSYGDARPDIAAAFPNYTNAAAAGGHFTLDTTTLTNGMHTIGWLVTDSCGRAEGMGSRFFTVANSASIATAAPALTAALTTSASQTWSVTRTDGSSEPAAAAADGTRVVRIAEGERIELQLPRGETYTARQAGAGSSRDLPIGSSFDAADGRFYWQPAPGFLGAYELEFAAGSRLQQLRVVVGPPIRMAIDTPRAGNVLSASGFTLAGWAVDLASLEGAGIDTLHVWAYPVGGGAPVFVGVARSGGERPDVTRLYGPAFGGAGFTLNGTLAPGTYDLVVYAHSAASNRFAGAETVRVIVR